MSKLNLINLSKDEIAKEEAQKIRGGVECPCTCICICDFVGRNITLWNTQTFVKTEMNYTA